MKVGILTYHRSHNYGALLQSIATRVVLERLGHSVYYIDYWPSYHRRMYALIDERLIFSWRIRRGLRYVFRNVLCVFKNKVRRRANMNGFIRQYIEPYCRPESEQYNVVLYGSDQIWRKQREGVGYNPIYFGKNNFKSDKHISYAASMGILPDCPKDAEKVSNLLSRLDRISVREEDLRDFLNNIGIRDVQVCIDPTLLLSAGQWDAIFPSQTNPKERYVLFYNLLPNSFDKKELIKFTNDRHCKLKVLHSKPIHKETPDDICTVSPEGFIDLVRNAEFIFTSSFHGLVFAIIYKKPFLASFSRNAGRADSILRQLGLDDYLLPPMSELPHDIRPIAYGLVEGNLEKMREMSMKYLIESVS